MADQPALDPEIVRSLADPRLIEALEVNATEALAAAVENLQGEVYRGPDMVRFISGAPLSLFNGVALARLPDERIDAAIEETLERFRARSAPMIWWVGPMTRPIDLGARLEVHGLTPGDEMPGMAVAINGLGPVVPLPSVVITTVSNLAELDVWARTGADGLEAEWAAAFLDTAAPNITSRNAQWAYHLARLDGQPVATCMTYLRAGVAGIFMVSTRPEARRRGIGGAITQTALLHAGELGYRVGVLQSSAMGFPAYRRLGFQTCTQYQEYHWTPPEKPDAGGR
jgi:GNAT superfamily N-acetyltransferase